MSAFVGKSYAELMAHKLGARLRATECPTSAAVTHVAMRRRALSTRARRVGNCLQGVQSLHTQCNVYLNVINQPRPHFMYKCVAVFKRVR